MKETKFITLLTLNNDDYIYNLNDNRDIGTKPILSNNLEHTKAFTWPFLSF